MTMMLLMMMMVGTTMTDGRCVPAAAAVIAGDEGRSRAVLAASAVDPA